MADATPVVVVPSAFAEAVRLQLHARGLVDRTRKTTKRGGDVLIPLLGQASIDLDRFHARIEAAESLATRPLPRDPKAVLERRFAEAGLPPEAMPRHWERLGDVVILTLPKPARPFAEAIAPLFGEVLRARTVVETMAGIDGRLRTPSVRVLWGGATETVHREGGIRYKLDVARVMFSSGNLAERVSIADRIRPGDVVVDLFAGIGYFALPIAVRARPAAVFACEVNPVAFGYLVENVRLNRAANVVPLLGDCRETAPRGVADWVVMGHFDSGDYLDVGIAALREEGRILYHCLSPADRDREGPGEAVRGAAATHGAEVLELTTRIVKSYAPRIDHTMVEAHLRTAPKGLSGPGRLGGPVFR